ncbi:MAG: U32 family peptidase [Candidatus Brocadiales bacterium]|nr:U32 family peptidase [Candidatus Brocadiales bacterium]
MSHPSYSQHKKPELLSPAGDMECFFAAVENGADAVYFGLKDFSARASADNFTIDDASKAIAYARKKSIRVYIAINTLIKTHELESVVDCLIALDELQPDALIIQDLGLLYLIQSQFSQFNLHASTQMTIHNLAGVNQLERMGFKRVVLSRELSVDEIKNISQNTNMETEVFVHGALCYSYSGLCFFSSMMGGRSGNRGRCAQPCRMYYKSQLGEGGYLFSMKDLRTLPHIKELMDAGIHSFKIEGRMKSPEYVAAVTHVYRQAIDGKLEDMDDAIRLMNTVFSRETTNSYLFDKSYQQTEKSTNNKQIKATDMINPAYPANIGSYAGEVIKSEKGYIKIRADADIGVRDLLQVFENSSKEPTLLHVKNIKVNGKRVFGIKAGDIAMIDTERQYRPGARLYLLSSQKIKENFAPKVPKKLVTSKIPVDLEIKIKPEGIGIKGTTRHFSLSRDLSVKLEKGIHRTTERENIRECFSRLGETPFELAGIHTEISGELFIPLSMLNETRRDYFQIFCEEWRKDRDRRCESIKKWLKGEIFEFANPTYGNFNWQLTNKGWHEQLPLLPLNKGGQRGLSVTDLSGKSSAKDVSGDEIRLSLRVDKPDYLNHLPLEKIYKIYIVLTDENVKNFTKKAGRTPPLSPPSQGGDGGGEGLFPDEACNQLMRGKDKVVFSLPTIMRDTGTGDMTYGYFKKVVQELISQGFRQFQISNLGAMELFEGEDVMVYADYSLYCLNPLSAMKLRELGFCRHTLSPEDGKDNLQMLFSADADVIVYQDTPLFTSETCIWANMKNTCPGRNRCGFKQVILENEYGDRFVTINEECKTVVINQKPFSITHLIPKLLDDGQRDFRIDLCYKDYTPEMISNIFLKIQDKSKIENSMMGNFERGLM